MKSSGYIPFGLAFITSGPHVKITFSEAIRCIYSVKKLMLQELLQQKAWQRELIYRRANFKKVLDKNYATDVVRQTQKHSSDQQKNTERAEDPNGTGDCRSAILRSQSWSNPKTGLGVRVKPKRWGRVSEYP